MRYHFSKTIVNLSPVLMWLVRMPARNPFDLLADSLPGARAAMGRNTLVVVGAVLDDGRFGFIILAGQADPAAGDLAAVIYQSTTGGRSTSF